jgi:hypothetical protein
MHKYGFHVNAASGRVFDAIVRVKPRIIKTLHHDVNFWRRVREVHPTAFIIGRLFTPNQEFLSDPEGRGREFAERILREEVTRVAFHGRPLYDGWESFNEAIPESVSPDEMRAYDAFQVSFGQRIRAAGFEPIAMNFGTGNFLGHHFLENFRETLETHRYLGFHEYDWPTLWRLHKESEAINGGMWLTLRYRRTMNMVRQAYPGRHTVIITECGMTQGVHPQGVGDVGPWHPSHPISEDDYWASMMWYNDELMKDDYVLGACLFVVGAISPWESFEHLGGIVDRLERLRETGPSVPESIGELAAPVTPSVEVAVDSGPAVGAVVDVPVETVTPAVEMPTVAEEPEQVEEEKVEAAAPSPETAGVPSHYVLFPPGVHWDWYEACRFYFERFRPSWGENPHDAARAQVITCINPDQETLDTLNHLNPSAYLEVIQATGPAELSARVGKRILRGKAYGGESIRNPALS